MYLNPVYNEEDLKLKKLPKHTTTLQTLQNNMIRVILGASREKHINMMNARIKLKIMSVNQICVYHTLLEAYNVMKNSSSEKIKQKWTNFNEKKYTLRSITERNIKVPEKPVTKCLGFTYNGAKLLNMLPRNLRETSNPKTFKILTKEWILNNIPSQ